MLQDIKDYNRKVKGSGFSVKVDPKLRLKLAPEFSGVVSYKGLVKLHSSLKYNMVDLQRLITFRQETIHKAIFQ